MKFELEISAAVAAILADAEADIASRRPVCRASGRCCQFEKYGHRLYVTGVESVHFAMVQGVGATAMAEGTLKGALRTTVSLPQFFAQDKPEGCPYQVGGLCTARDA